MSTHSRASKHGGSGLTGRGLKRHPIPHLGIRSRGLNSHLLLTRFRFSKLARFVVAFLHGLFVSMSSSYHSGKFCIIRSQGSIACPFRTQQANQAWQSRSSRVCVERHSTTCALHPTSWHPCSLAHSCSPSQACPGGHIVSTAPEQSAGSQNNHLGKSVSRSWRQMPYSVMCYVCDPTHHASVRTLKSKSIGV